jgi:hypothetical protein
MVSWQWNTYHRLTDDDLCPNGVKEYFFGALYVIRRGHLVVIEWVA